MTEAVINRIIHQFETEPRLRVKAAQADGHIDLSFDRPVLLIDALGAPVFPAMRSDRFWRIRLETVQPPQFFYTIQLALTPDRVRAESLVTQLNGSPWPVRIEPISGPVVISGKMVADNTVYRVVLGDFNTETDARHEGWRLLDSKGGCRIIRDKIRDARPRFEVFDAEYEQVSRVTGRIQVIPRATDVNICLYHTHWAEQNGEDALTLSGPFDVDTDLSGQLAVIRNVYLEDYVAGVLMAYRHPGVPFETMKALAVAVRGYGLSRLGHGHLLEAFDLCNERHCQLYDGGTKITDDVSRAVSETRGRVFRTDDGLCGQGLPLNCIDWQDASTLSQGCQGQEDALKARIQAHSALDCQGHGNEKNTEYRWEVSYGRRELEAILEYKTGHAVGTLYDLIVLDRTPEGYMRCLEVVGAQENYKIHGEYAIREALSETRLASSCFVVERQYGADGFLSELTLWGIGKGHGLGLCLEGAAELAQSGKRYQEILAHYWKGGSIETIYT